MPQSGGTPATNPAGIVFAGSASCDNNEVPEFGVIAGAIALVGALGIFLYRRKN
jgi:LPXTG-motif cell wall-anchored protein